MFKVGDIIQNAHNKNRDRFKVVFVHPDNRIDIVVQKSSFLEIGKIYKREWPHYFRLAQKPYRGHHLTRIFK